MSFRKAIEIKPDFSEGYLNFGKMNEVFKKFEVKGNSRISTETLKVYGEIELNKDYSSDDINEIIKKLYDTKFFSNISANFSNNILIIASYRPV